MNLIEVLVSLFVLSLALLSLNAIQLTTLKQTQAIVYFNLAEQRIHEWLNHPNKESHLSLWKIENESYLPNAETTVTTNEIVIKWGGLKEECSHSIIEKAGCIYFPIVG